MEYDFDRKCYTLGELKNCQKTVPLGYYRLPNIEGCTDLEKAHDKLETFKGKVLRYNPTVTPLILWRCKVRLVNTKCSSWGKTTTKVINRPVTRNECHDMVKLERTTGYYKEKLYQFGRYYYKSTPRKPSSCHLFGKATSYYAAHFEIQGYKVKVIGSSDLIQQTITQDELYLNRNNTNILDFHVPSEQPETMLAWFLATARHHDWKDIKPISDLTTIQKIGNFLHIPSLEIGGQILYDHPLVPNDRKIPWYALDNGIVVEGNGSRIDYRKSQMKEIVFLAKKFADDQGLPLIQAHLIENLVNVRQQAVLEAKRTCFIQKEIRNIHRWLSDHFPDMVSELVFGRRDIVAQPSGDAFSVSECLTVHYRCLVLDRRNSNSKVNDSCFQYFKLDILGAD